MKYVFAAFVVLYVAAVLLFLIGTFGWFGQETDPLSGVFLIPLGLPWNLIADKIGLSGVLVGVLSPLINLAIVYWFWKR